MKLRVLAIFFLFFFSFQIPNISSASSSPTHPTDYIPHAPIWIEGDENFTPEHGVVSGNGTPDDPYIIEGWVVDTSQTGERPIYIAYTSAHFVIRNCKFIGYFCDFDECANGTIIQNIFENCSIWFERTTNMRILENTIRGNEKDNWGIYVSGDNFLIQNNTILNFTAWGIYGFCSNITIIGNIFNSTVQKQWYGTLYNCGGIHIGCMTSLQILNNSFNITKDMINGGNLRCCGVEINEEHNSLIVISGNEISSSECALFVNGGDLTVFTHNRVLNGNVEIWVSTSETVISKNFINENLGISYPSYTTIDNNTVLGMFSSFNPKHLTFIDNEIRGGITWELPHNADTHTIINTTAGGEPIFYVKNLRDAEIEKMRCGQLILVNASNVTITDSVFVSGGCAVYSSANLTFQRDSFYYMGMHTAGVYNLSVTDSLFFLPTYYSQFSSHPRQPSTLFLTNNIFYQSPWVAMYIDVDAGEIYNNSFVENNMGSYQVRDYSGGVLWNSSYGGNYWSDWREPDENNDGIVDVPYPCGSHAKDYLPLVRPPKILIIHKPPAFFAEVGEKLRFEARVIGRWSAVENVTLHYSANGSDWLSINLARESGDGIDGNYSANLTVGPWNILEYYLSASDGGNSSCTQVYEIVINSTEPPMPPRNLTASGRDKEVNLYWLPSKSKVLSYNLYCILEGKKNLIATLPANALSYTHTNVTPGIVYGYYVTAVNSNGESETSNMVTVRPGATPGKPEKLSAQVFNFKVLLSWNPPEYSGEPMLTEYRIYRGLSADNKSLIAIVDANTTTYLDTDVKAERTYYYHVTAVNVLGESEPSNAVSVFVPFGKIVVRILASKTTIRSFESSELEVLAIDEETGRGISNATVLLSTNLPGIFAQEIGITDANGSFKTTFKASAVNESIFDKIFVSVSAEGYENASAGLSIGILPKELKISVEIKETEVEAGASFEVKVRVVDENGMGVENATVMLSWKPDDIISAETSAITDGNGCASIRLKAVKEGIAILHFSVVKEGYAKAGEGAGIVIKKSESEYDFGIPLAILLIVLLVVGLWKCRRDQHTEI